MSPASRQLFQVILLFALVVLSGSAIYLGLRAANTDTSVDDSSAAENNCCTTPGCPNYNGDWVAGYEACLRGECTQCAGGGIACNQNKICQSGENEGNCPSDCDNAGYSQLDTEGVVCDPGQTDR